MNTGLIRQKGEERERPTVTCNKLISLLFLSVLMAWPTALARQDEAPDQESAEEDAEEADESRRRFKRGDRRRERILREYEKTGEVENCVRLRTFRQSLILDDQTIFFEAMGRKGYMVHLPHRCPGLYREERFVYSVSFGALCSQDIITVLDNFGRTWGSCGLGKFEEYKKKPKGESDGDSGEPSDGGE